MKGLRGRFRRKSRRRAHMSVEPGDGPKVAIVPDPDRELVDAVHRGGGRLSPPDKADAFIWTDPRDPASLGELVKKSSPRWVQLPFAGIEAFVESGVVDTARTWTCAKGIYGPATAEHAVALILAAARRIHEHARSFDWRPTGRNAPERRLRDRTVLLVGTGGIGRSLVPMLVPFGPRLVAVNRSGAPLDGVEVTGSVTALPGLLAEADFVVLAAASTPETRGLIDRAMLEYMKRDAWLINVARGDLVVTDDLVAALERGAIGGAALDVTDPEPLPEGHRLWGMDNVLITPHVANTWDMALPELAGLIERNLRAFASGGDLEGVVDLSLGY